MGQINMSIDLGLQDYIKKTPQLNTAPPNMLLLSYLFIRSNVVN